MCAIMKRAFHQQGLIVASFFVLALPALRAQSDEPNVETLLQQMEAAYSVARSYSDTSSVRFRNPDEGDGARVEFKIWFSRPKFIRIDATSRRAPDAPSKREVMWFDGDTARMWSSTSPVVTRGEIQLAGSKMFGSYAYHIPTLLEASYAGPRRLHQLTSPSIAGEETIEDVACYHLHGDWQGDAYDIWIGKEDHLVRKIVANYSGYLMEELHRAIVVNQPMDMTVFRFAPENEVRGPTKEGTPPPRLPGERTRP